MFGQRCIDAGRPCDYDIVAGLPFALEALLHGWPLSDVYGGLVPIPPTGENGGRDKDFFVLPVFWHAIQPKLVEIDGMKGSQDASPGGMKRPPEEQ